jgi:hypothetical protein
MNLKRIIEDRIQVHGAYERLFSTDDGKIVLQHLMKHGFVFESTFVAGDPHKTALNEGSRRLAISILKYAKKTPQEMLKEIENALQA